VALDLVAVPLFDANGAATVMVAVRVLAIALFTFRVRRAAGIATPPPAVGLVAAAILGAIAGDRLAGYGMVASLGGASVVFLATALATRGLRIADLRDARIAWAQSER
jgi:hypothetical protein